MGKKQTTTASSEPWGPIQPYLTDTAAQIDRLASNNRLDPFVAPSALTRDYIQGMGALGRDNPFTAQTMGNYSDFMGANTSVAGPQLRGDLGPVQLSGDTFGMDRISDFVMSKTLPQVASMFGQGGFANSTMAQQTAGDAVTNALTPFAQQQFNLDRGRMDENTYYNAAQGERMLNRSDANAWANTGLGERNIERGLQRDLSGLQLAPLINNMQFTDLAALGQAGQARDAINQDRANTPSNNVQMAAQLYGGLGGLGGSQTQTQPGPGAVQTAGDIGQLATNAYLSYLLLCDRRTKADIEPTGATYRGVDLYTFRYLWDDPDVRRIGPMAQEVPVHARVTLPSGFLAVDMGAL